jgi:MerR HTH family regulatory protein
MARLLITDVTLARDGRRITAHVRFKAGQATSIEAEAGLPAYEIRRTPHAIIAEIDQLLEDHTEAGVADQLNQRGLTSGTGQPFHAGIVHHIRVSHQLAPREQRLRARGLVGLPEAARRLGVCTHTIKKWHHDGLLAGEKLNDKGEHYYQIPAVTPRKATGRPPGRRNQPKP